VRAGGHAVERSNHALIRAKEARRPRHARVQGSAWSRLSHRIADWRAVPASFAGKASYGSLKLYTGWCTRIQNFTQSATTNDIHLNHHLEQVIPSGVFESKDGVMLTMVASESHRLKRQSVVIMVLAEVLPQLCTVVVLWHSGELDLSWWSVGVVVSAASFLVHAVAEQVFESYALRCLRQDRRAGGDALDAAVDSKVFGAPTWL
jgi:hypothetical protein